jgi:phosphatidylglycerophosphatase A
MLSGMPATSSPAALEASRPPRAGGAAALVATALGAGYAPVAPGTAGSLVGLALFWPMSGLGWPVALAATAGLFLLGVRCASRVAAQVGRKDPGIVVVDEVAGMWVTLLAVPFTPATAALGFLAFRVMDVFKPYPARQLEALPGGWGIMADDIMAGVYANLLVQVLLRAWSAA